VRTTLTLDDDVAAQLDELRKKRKLTLKQAVNDALRSGLRHLHQPERKRAPFRTKPASVGRLLIEDLDDVGAVLAEIDGDAFK
jgi:hypothetical protein